MKIMKSTSFILSIFLSCIGSNVCGQITSRKDSSFIPLAVGNYWIYSNSFNEDIDTLKIVAKKIVWGIPAFEFNTGYTLFERNDSIFDFQPGEGMEPCSSLVYFPSEGYTMYSIIIGCDMGSSRSVSKIQKPYTVNGKQYLNCYKFTTPEIEESFDTIISYGVGIISLESRGNTKTLLEYKLSD